MADGMKMTLEGDKQLQYLFKELPKRVIKKGLRAAMTAAASPIVRLAKGKARKQSGLLRKSIGKKVKTFPSGVVTAIVGPRRQIQGEYMGRKRVPANYAHIVEKQFPYLDPAYESGKGQALQIAEDKLRESVTNEAIKLGKL